MKNWLHIIAFCFPHIIWGQFSLLNTPYQDAPFAHHALTIGVGNQTLDLGSNANLGRWNDATHSGNEVFAYSEWNQEMLRIQYQHKNIQWGYHASYYSYQTRFLNSELFNLLFGDDPLLNQTTSFRHEDRSSFTHSISARIGLNEKTDFTLFTNFHQINSFTQRRSTGEVSITENATSIGLLDQIWSFNNDYIYSDDAALLMPNDISSHDSVHITTVFKQRLTPSISFKLRSQPTPYSEIIFFANNLGFSNRQWISSTTQQSKVDITSTTINTDDLLNSSTLDLNPWTTNTTTLNPDSLRVLIKARPSSMGGQLAIEFQPKMALIAGVSSTRYPTYLNIESQFLARFETSTNSYFHVGIGTENIQRKWLSNIILGATMKATPMITYSVNTTTGINYAFANSTIAPRTLSRMNYYFSLAITLP